LGSEPFAHSLIAGKLPLLRRIKVGDFLVHFPGNIYNIFGVVDGFRTKFLNVGTSLFYDVVPDSAFTCRA
jgi:hypothetical protein